MYLQIPAYSKAQASGRRHDWRPYHVAITGCESLSCFVATRTRMLSPRLKYPLFPRHGDFLSLGIPPVFFPFFHGTRSKLRQPWRQLVNLRDLGLWLEPLDSYENTVHWHIQLLLPLRLKSIERVLWV
jgi:hypothetical protein